MVGTHCKIEDDLFGVALRLRNIDDGYFVAFNYKTKKFEVHSRNQRGGTLALVLPFSRLDCRTIDHVLKTRSERRKQLLEEIEKENKRLERDEIKRLVKKTEREVENANRKI